MQTIKLYSTDGCHLCEQAYSLLLSLGSIKEEQVEIIEIAYDDELFKRYGVTIPVLSINKNELNWPFDHVSLTNWLNNNGIN